MTAVLETSLITPPSSNDSTVDELSIPVTFLDIIWIRFQHPIRRLLFYRYPSCSKEFFVETLIPKLKESLSLALKHYLPVAGSLLYPLDKDDSDKKPFIRYKNGDAVPFTIAESDKNFDDLIKNHPRDADQFYGFVPEMPPFEEEPGYKVIPLFAIKATFFRGHGFCVSFSNHHTLGDGNSIVGFIKTWASISKQLIDLTSKELVDTCVHQLPLFDRYFIKDPLGIVSIFWKVIKEIPLSPPSFPLPTNRVRATYTLHQSDIKKLKDYVLAKKPDLGRHVSSFVVTASYAWSCFVKSCDASSEKADDDDDDDADEDYFIFPVDVRSRVDPPVPNNYFGNCLSYGLAKMEHRILIGEEGFVMAAESVVSDIKNRLNNKDEVLRGAENWFSEGSTFSGKRVLGVSGSPKFDLYEVDFGWGKAEKLEVASIDGEKYSMSLSKSRVSEGGLEIGFSLPREMMEAFAAVFDDGLKTMD